MDILIYVTILSVDLEGKEDRRIRFTKTIEKAETDFKELLEMVKTEQQYIGRPYKLSTYKASEIINSRAET